ncbi:hypothetical protein P280DRAFT_239127 [Massarina eburnea CBS 473.64]|uniref:Uncharacterized protein n=1 Tax=Massarina eburnea CBS 473.64 TaxID=1395130 RepID=A0A6A6RHE2_9PLEO|nr:hypothetical protein P280DRAFT_239127 [Massarina eburnea CBS 473.64]
MLVLLRSTVSLAEVRCVLLCSRPLRARRLRLRVARQPDTGRAALKQSAGLQNVCLQDVPGRARKCMRAPFWRWGRESFTPCTLSCKPPRSRQTWDGWSWAAGMLRETTLAHEASTPLPILRLSRSPLSGPSCPALSHPSPPLPIPSPPTPA